VTSRRCRGRNDSFDVVTGFSSFQFADDKIRALAEAARVSRDLVAAVIPTRVPEAGIASVFSPLLPLFPSDALAMMKDSGMFALSEPGRLDALLSAVGSLCNRTTKSNARGFPRHKGCGTCFHRLRTDATRDHGIGRPDRQRGSAPGTHSLHQAGRSRHIASLVPGRGHQVINL
jgi:hypothetical protein